ncbi:synaptogyrin-1 isoform X2 [Marmota marmota marmota]|uniref:synaptogyrin-1 isoform X2 n=1 Tax=Marmota marmota marmota TaxID=9994 RepID=UPI0020921BCC|nr:synaptogyrin-1 isoform X2 [Marmota marmota marmota]
MGLVDRPHWTLCFYILLQRLPRASLTSGSPSMQWPEATPCRCVYLYFSFGGSWGGLLGFLPLGPSPRGPRSHGGDRWVNKSQPGVLTWGRVTGKVVVPEGGEGVTTTQQGLQGSYLTNRKVGHTLGRGQQAHSFLTACVCAIPSLWSGGTGQGQGQRPAGHRDLVHPWVSDSLCFLIHEPKILEFGSGVFSIVVFGSIVNEGYLNSPSEGEEFCIYNRNASACSYGVAVGVLAFLTCLLYLALDVYFPQISSVKDRKKAVLSDIGVSAFWAFLWFVGFCYLANQWQVSKPKDNPLNEGTDAARAAIAFSFFSIFTWDYMDPSQDSSMPYAPYVEPSTGPDPAGMGGTYQQPANAFDTEPQGYQSQGY